jgi:hypothetical protein
VAVRTFRLSRGCLIYQGNIVAPFDIDKRFGKAHDLKIFIFETVAGVLPVCSFPVRMFRPLESF